MTEQVRPFRPIPDKPIVRGRQVWLRPIDEDDLEASAGFIALGLLRLRPRWFPWIVNGMFGVVVAETFYTMPLMGGNIALDFGAVFLLIIPLGALMILGRLPDDVAAFR